MKTFPNLILRVVLAAGVAFAATMLAGAWHVSQVIARLQLSPSEAESIGLSRNYEWSRVLGLAVGTTAAIVVCAALIESVSRAKSRWIRLSLVPVYAILLVMASTGVHWPDREFIRQGWHVYVEPFLLYWPLLCGVPILVGYSIARNRWRTN
jgi:hypothetical protein